MNLFLKSYNFCFEKENLSESLHPSRNVIDNGHFGSNGVDDWTDAELFLENGLPISIISGEEFLKIM